MWSLVSLMHNRYLQTNDNKYKYSNLNTSVENDKNLKSNTNEPQSFEDSI